MSRILHGLTTDPDGIYERLATSARAHGENGEAEMEVGDLQEVVARALKLMTWEQRDRLLYELAQVLNGPEYEWLERFA